MDQRSERHALRLRKRGIRARPVRSRLSDAFFPFPDGPQLLLDAGITAIIQPGGSQRDQEPIDAANRANAVMMLTGERHFMH